MAIMKYWDSGNSKWVPFDAGNAVTLGGKAPSEFAPTSHVGSGGGAHTIAAPNGEAGFLSGADKYKLDGIQAGAEKNKSAFGQLRIGGQTLNADTPTSTFELVSGNNIQLSLDAASGKITIGTSMQSAETTTPGGTEPERLAKTDASGRVGDSERLSGQTLYELDLRYASAGEGGGASGDGEAVFQQQVESKTLTASTAKVVVPMTGYDQTKHILFAFKNGAFIQLGQEYTIDNSDGSINKISGTWSSGTVFDFLVMSVDSSGDMLQVHQYESFTLAAEGQITFDINIPEYVAGFDALNVYQNGLRLVHERHYTISGDGQKVTLTGYAAEGQAEMQFVVLKKKKV